MVGSIDRGKIIWMTGPSGSGKTTLLTLMGGLRSGQEGKLQIVGQEPCGAHDLKRMMVRRQIGCIFQLPNFKNP